MGLQIPPTFCISSLKKNPAENDGAPDPANFLHQLPQKESGGKLWGSRSRQLSASAEKEESGRKLWGSRSRQLSASAEKEESGGKLWGSRSRQLSASASSLKKNPSENYGSPDPANFLHQPAPSKRIRRKIMGLQIPPTFCISSLKKKSGGKLWGSRSRQLSASAEKEESGISKRIRPKLCGVSSRRISKRIPPNLKKNPPRKYVAAVPTESIIFGIVVGLIKT